MVFVARHLRYDLPEPVADLLTQKEAWGYAKYDKPIILVGQYGSLVMKGDWFVGRTRERVD
jgi:hypothetical protein